MEKNSLVNLLSPKEWWVEEHEFEIDNINYYETIFTIGNGYLCTRGSLEGTHTASFPETFINGVFDHNDSSIVHMVNTPDWIPVHIYANNERLCIQNSKVLEHYRVLDMRQGTLYRRTRFEDPEGNITCFETLRYASFSEQHLCEMRINITPENYSGEVVIKSEIDGHQFNLDRIPAYGNIRTFDPEVKWKKWAKSKHLAHITTKSLEKDTLYLEMKTLDRPHRIGYASALNVLNYKPTTKRLMNDYERTQHTIVVDAKKGKTIELEKLATIYTSREISRNEIQNSCHKTLQENLKAGFEKRFNTHKKVWINKWDKCDIQIVGDPKANHAVRFSMYHMLIAANENDPTVNVGAKSMSGEGYKGHIFWDTEIFTLPFFVYTQPETARSLILYRYHTLRGARENAESTGYKGARYPWESADDGHEETPKWSADGQNRIWPGEEEIHITADVVQGVFTYYIATGDTDFMLKFGAEIIFETARFWASRLEHNEEHDRYELSSVIGPDEFHEHVNNNVFTNWMARWNLQKAAETYHWLQSNHRDHLTILTEQLDLKPSEIDHWREIAKKIYVLFDPETKLFEEFENYYKLRDVTISNWDEHGLPIYPEGYGDFNSGGTMLVKQADVVALMYVLSDEFDDETKKVNFEFYEPRTMHSSSLSTSVHSIMAIDTRCVKRAIHYFHHTAFIDLHDRKGSTEDGIHIAASGGTWQSVVAGFGGMRVKNRKLTFKPWLPTNWEELHFKLQWHGDELKVCIRHEEAEFYWETEKTDELAIEVMHNHLVLRPNTTATFKFTPEAREIEIPVDEEKAAEFDKPGE